MKKNILAIFAAAAMAVSMAACGAKGTGAKTDGAADKNAAAIVGSWQLNKVLVSEKEGEEAVEVSEADHASMFEEKNSVYTFNEDGTGTLVAVDGPDKVEKEMTWADAQDAFAVTVDDITEDYVYDPVDDTLTREFIENNSADQYMRVVFVFTRQ